MAQAMGLQSGSDVGPAIVEMNQRLGLPSGLSEMGVKTTDFENIITGALADHCHKTNPRIASAHDYHEMLSQASHNYSQ